MSRRAEGGSNSWFGTLRRNRATEINQANLGNLPWRDLGRYLRNIPIFYVKKVQTPVLIIQGDLDYAPPQQGEEMFTGCIDKASGLVLYGIGAKVTH
jgi:dipeptidyl aminopeptidase/acylaminoacyl peptidase